MFFNQNIIFKQKTIDESAYDLYKRFYTSRNSFEKKTLVSRLKEDKPSLKLCKDFLRKETAESNEVGMLDGFKMFWVNHSQSIVQELQHVLECEDVLPRQILCFLDMSPYMLIDYNNATISLSVNHTLKENIDSFVAFLVKYAVVDRLWNGETMKINLSYSKDSVYWIMADFVADSICYYSSLPCFDISPAYKFYYSLSYNGENLIQKFRALYNKMPILEFMHYILEFVEHNYDMFECFTNRY